MEAVTMDIDVDEIERLALQVDTPHGEWWPHDASKDPRGSKAPTVRCWTDAHRTQSKRVLQVGYGNHMDHADTMAWERAVADYLAAVRPAVVIELIRRLRSQEETQQSNRIIPQRVQRRRTKGWRMPENTVYVGRPTVWGNPYRPLDQYERDLREDRLLISVVDVQQNLRGKNLACWCPLDQPCHADVLLRIANEEEECAP